MRKKFFLARLGALAPAIAQVAAVAAMSGCSARPSTYKIALRYLPKEGDPFTGQVNTDQLVMDQLYYPLFTRLTSGALASEFLDLDRTRAEGSDFARYNLCLKEGLRYSDGKPIRAPDLVRALVRSHKNQDVLPALRSVTAEGSCAIVTLAAVDLRYFDKLASISSTIVSDGRSQGGFPVGLGPYRIAGATAQDLKLIANPGRVQGDFHAIEFVKFKDVESDFKKGVIDFNHTGQVELPEDVRAHFQQISRPLYKSYALVLNYPDAKLRQAFVNCFKTVEFKQILDMPLEKTPGFLPLGIPGSALPPSELPSKPLTTLNMAEMCRPRDVPPLVFFNYKTELQPAVRKFFRAHQGELPIPVEFRSVTVEDLVKNMFAHDRVAAVIGFDSSTSLASAPTESFSFFESFTRQSRHERLITTPVPELEKITRTALIEADPQLKESHYRKAHRLLLDSGYVIPLGQLETDQYYPKYISNISWSDRITGYPRIDLMQAD